MLAVPKLVVFVLILFIITFVVVDVAVADDLTTCEEFAIADDEIRPPFASTTTEGGGFGESIGDSCTKIFK